jgi:hypothetical protein
MIDLYSFLLVLAVLLVTMAVASALGSYWSRSPRGLGAARLLAILAAACDLASVLVHLAFGHRPGSSAALPFTAFLTEHPAFVAVFALAIFAWAASRRTA